MQAALASRERTRSIVSPSKRRLEIVHVISDAGPHPYFETIAAHTDRERHRLRIGCVGPAGDLQRDMRAAGVATFALGARGRAGHPAAVLLLARELRRSRVDVVQTHLVDGSLVGLAAARLAQVPLAILTAHHSHEVPFHGRRLLYAERLCAGPLCDRIIAPASRVAETMTAAANVPRAKIEVIHHGFDLQRLDPQAADGRSVRAQLGLGDDVLIGAIGRHFWIKNHAALVRAFAQIAGDFPDARLVIVGGGEKADLASLARELSIGERVVLSGPRSDIPRVLAALDVFVHPALAESFGMVIVEAMAMAKPVVSTKVGIAPEVIEDDVSGLLARSADSGELALSLRRMLDRRDRWPEIGAKARRRVEGFTGQSMVRGYEDGYARWLEVQRGCDARAERTLDREHASVPQNGSAPTPGVPDSAVRPEPPGAPDPPDISITLVVYNSGEHLPETLRSIRDDVSSGLAEVLVVDNASPDDSAAIVARELPEARIVTASSNRGFAAGCNLAWPLARGRYWMLLNPDVTVPHEGLRVLVDWMDAHPDLGIGSPEVVDGAGRRQSPGRTFPSIGLALLELGRVHRLLPAGMRGRRFRGPYWAGGDQTGVVWVPGTAMIVRRQAVESTGLLSEDFFVYGEDIEWCWRIARSGWGIGVCSTAAFVHGAGSSANRTWGPQETERRIARGTYQACERIRGGVYARLFALTTALALRVESGHPLRPREDRARTRQLSRVWLDVARARTRDARAAPAAGRP